MGTTLMNEKRGSRKRAVERDIEDVPVIVQGEEKEPTTSTRLYVSDQIQLGKLASLRNENIADTFRNVLRTILDSALVAAAESEANRIRAEQKK